MKDRDYDREQQWRSVDDNDNWDWYYYEYRYVPYSPYRRNDFDRNYNDYGRTSSRGSNEGDYNRDYNYNRDYYARDYDYNYGRYSGVGPRGYQRSDERIADDVNDRLTWHGGLDATDVQVEVNDGVVTLKGSVDDRRQKRIAEHVAERVSGVWDVNNQLTIRNRFGSRGNTGRMSNGQIRNGMEVVDRDGEHVGEVKEVRSNDFLVDRSMARDVYIPMNECQMSAGQIRLNVRADEVDNQDWEMPEIFETESAPQKKR